MPEPGFEFLACASCFLATILAAPLYVHYTTATGCSPGLFPSWSIKHDLSSLPSPIPSCVIRQYPTMYGAEMTAPSGIEDARATSAEEEGPLSSPRSIESEPNFEIAPLPVICIRKDGSSPEMLPAVRANHPSMGIAIFPLNRIELGDIWYGKARLSTWEIKILPGGWASAFQKFSSLIHYPTEFLSPALEALHQQSFLDKTPLSWTQWSNLCKNTSTKLYAVADCRVCGTPRCLSMRLLNEVNRTLDTFQCRSVGARCGEESIGRRIFDTYQDIPLPTPLTPHLLPWTPMPPPYSTPRMRMPRGLVPDPPSSETRTVPHADHWKEL